MSLVDQTAGSNKGVHCNLKGTETSIGSQAFRHEIDPASACPAGSVNNDMINRHKLRHSLGTTANERTKCHSGEPSLTVAQRRLPPGIGAICCDEHSMAHRPALYIRLMACARWLLHISDGRTA
uniref:Uncharacterized protein n=1 Tax=Anopheles coluzzii TaxID=1518534 RepID=A0A8W7P1Q9_ANOCL